MVLRGIQEIPYDRRKPKLRILAWLLVLSLCLSLCGCGWMDGSYHSVTPHLPEKIDAKQDTVTIDSGTDLVTALMHQVEQGSASVVIYCRTGTEEQLKSDMIAALSQLSQSNGIYAYAVDEIQYEIGQRNSQTAISVQFSYFCSIKFLLC